jgi:hypothetical protein
MSLAWLIFVHKFGVRLHRLAGERLVVLGADCRFRLIDACLSYLRHRALPLRHGLIQTSSVEFGAGALAAHLYDVAHAE